MSSGGDSEQGFHLEGLSHVLGDLCASLVTERAQMSSFPKLESVLGSIFWNRELWRCKMLNGSQGFTAFSAMGFAVLIKCSEGFWWGLGEIQPLYFLALGSSLTSG